MIEKTVRVLADEIGVSKQRIQQIIDKLPESQAPKKRGNRYVLSELDEKNIKIAMGLIDPETSNNEKYRQKTTNIDNQDDLSNEQISTNIDKKSKIFRQGSEINNKEQQISTTENNNVNSNPAFNSIFDLIKNEISEKNEQIKEKDKQINQLQKLLENQQVLTLQAQEKIKLLEESKKEEKEPSPTDNFQQEEPQRQGFFAKWFK